MANRLVFRSHALPERGEWKRAIPQALAVLGAIGLGVGIFDARMREALAPLLWGCLFVAVVSGAAYWWIRGMQRCEVSVFSGASGTRLTLRYGRGQDMEVSLEDVDCGQFEKMVSLGSGRVRRVRVLWVAATLRTGRSIIFNQARFVTDPPPSGWPFNNAPEGDGFRGIDAEQLWRALAPRTGANG